MAGTTQIIGLGLGVDANLNGAGTIVRRNSGGDTDFGGGINADGEGSLITIRIFTDH